MNKSLSTSNSNHGNRTRCIYKIFDSLYKKSYTNNSPSLSNFSVSLIDTVDWRSKFEKNTEKDSKVKVVQKILSKELTPTIFLNDLTLKKQN